MVSLFISITYNFISKCLYISYIMYKMMKIDFVRIQSELIDEMTCQPGGHNSLKIVFGHALDDFFNAQHFHERRGTVIFNYGPECCGVLP